MPVPFYEKYALIVILGHYGSGKTNLALNLALKLRDAGRSPTLVDLDVVNPYFRSTDYEDLATSAGISLIGPVFGSSNLDAPSLSPGIDGVITGASLDAPVILDVGGDTDGARALARYLPSIRLAKDKVILAVVNTRRPDTQSVDENLAMLEGLSAATGLGIDALVGNTHLAEFTTRQTVLDSLPVLEGLSAASGIPLVTVTVPAGPYAKGAPQGEGLQEGDTLQESGTDAEGEMPLLPVERLVKTVWQ